MCLLAYVLWRLRDRVRPGVVFALYLLLSGLERFLVEFIRRNNEVFAGLTAPQLESIALIVIGLAWLVVMLRGGAALRAALRPSMARRRRSGRRPPEPARDNQRPWPPVRASPMCSPSAAA